MRRSIRVAGALSALLFVMAVSVIAQAPPGKEAPGQPKQPGGFGGPGFGGPGSAGPGGFGFGGPMMAAERKLVKDFDKDGNGRLNNEERQAAREQIKKEPRRGFGPGGGGPGGPGRFNPGTFLAKPILDAIDADANDKVSKEEFLAGAKKLYAECDKPLPDDAGARPPGEAPAKEPAKRPPGKEGASGLDEAQITAGINRIAPRPTFPGGGAFGPPGAKEAPGAKEPPPKEAPKGDGEFAPKRREPREGPFGFGGVRNFGPGTFLAASIVRRADKDKNSRVTADEWNTAAAAIFAEADKNKDGQLDESDVGSGLALLTPEPRGFGPGGPGGFGRESREPPKPGPRVSPSEVKSFADASLYEPTVLRTLFLEFENKDWEAELADFHGTDVEVPATLIVDGKKYAEVGVHFRGMSSYGMVPAGLKRSLNLSLDFADGKQRLNGYKTLNLLNCHEDASCLSSVLYSHIARQYIPAPKANFVKVVINGESWGVYANVQQYDKTFLSENYKSDKGTRWKVRGSPGGGGGLEYLGENIEDYQRRYEMKSGGTNEKAWRALIKLCKTLQETPADKLEEALRPMVDIDGLLKFLALDVALINNDGYWVRASDYSIYLDEAGKFHFIPHDMNEAFHGAMGFGFGGPGGRGPGGFGGPGGPGGGFGGPGGRGGDRPRDFRPPGDDGAPGERPKGKERPDREAKRSDDAKRPDGDAKRPGGFGGRPGGGGLELDPLVALDDPRKPLRSKVLAAPALKARYLEYVRTIADKSLDWSKLGPVVKNYRELLEKEIATDTRKLGTTEGFLQATANEAATEGTGPGFGRRQLSLRAFADGRRKYLLEQTKPRPAGESGDRSQ